MISRSSSVVMEEWRPIEGFPLYEISNLGRIKSFHQSDDGKILACRVNQDGYIETSPLCPGRKTFRVHRLVASAFIPNLENHPEIDHIDGNRSNNIVSNLRWVPPIVNRQNQRLRENNTGEPFISVRYVVRFRGSSIPNMEKNCQTLEQAIKVRDEWMEKHGYEIKS